MKTLAAAEAKNHFGHLLDMAQRNPITIAKKGRPVAVVISLHDYEHFEQLEDQLWAIKALEAAKDGYLTEDASKKFLDNLGHDED